MADIRIKDLTTLESASLTGDVFVIDGTTGTRKLSAFSPTFGGNATVTGTLTVNGGATVGGGSFAAASFYKSSSLGSVLSGATGSSYDLYITNPAGNYILQVPTGTRNAEFAGTLTTVGNATVGAALTVQATTASTTTSTGALVVGNGTSGGLGVGGAINAGSGAHVFGNAAANTTFTVSRITTSPSSIQLQAISSQALLDFTSETAAGYTWGRIASNGSEILRVHNSNLAAITPVSGGGLAVGGGLNVSATTASTSTSSGALVVSGGVGVAKSVTVGENIDIGTGHGTKLYVNNSGAWSNKELLVTGYADSTDFTQIKVPGNASNTASLKLDQTGLVTISGAVRTAAPSGGTAANWKLGTVATVSPTSPNRTIEVDIGGTIYYLAAKTTNN